MTRTVLIVEDVDVCRDALELAFMQVPHLAIRSVATAEEALRCLDANAFCALVTDVHLPRMDGFELIQKIRSDSRYAPLPILVISGDTDPRTQARLLSLGANAYFSKPYSPAEVRHKLEQLIDGF
ncbi:MAG: response regulator [Bryobacteraceae bacterium]|jgi:CheY-like chemotaxis protein